MAEHAIFEIPRYTFLSGTTLNVKLAYKTDRKSTRLNSSHRH